MPGPHTGSTGSLPKGITEGPFLPKPEWVVNSIFRHSCLIGEQKLDENQIVRKLNHFGKLSPNPVNTKT
jgi:hypothetical protein